MSVRRSTACKKSKKRKLKTTSRKFSPVDRESMLLDGIDQIEEMLWDARNTGNDYHALQLSIDLANTRIKLEQYYKRQMQKYGTNDDIKETIQGIDNDIQMQRESIKESKQHLLKLDNE